MLRYAVDMDIKRLDHLGIVAGVIKDLGLIEAIAGMISNGLGFSDRPLSLTLQFFETKALEVLFAQEF